MLHVGLHNTLSDGDAPTGGSCKVTFFSPYWLNNRTGALAGLCALPHECWVSCGRGRLLAGST